MKTPKLLRISLKKLLVLILGIGGTLFLLVFLLTSYVIGREVAERCRTAQKSYSGDCVEALSALLNDDKNDFRLRNSAIWALGQLGDSRALPVLEKYYTGNIPPKEPLSQSLSQYELKKARELAKGNFNTTHFIWRKSIK